MRNILYYRLQKEPAMKRFLSLVLLVSMLLPACFAANYSVVVTNGKGCDTFSDS